MNLWESASHQSYRIPVPKEEPVNICVGLVCCAVGRQLITMWSKSQGDECGGYKGSKTQIIWLKHLRFEEETVRIINL